MHVRSPVSIVLTPIVLCCFLAACAREEPYEIPRNPAGPPLPVQRTAGPPDGWRVNSPSSYVVGTDRTNQRTGAAAVYLTAATPSAAGHATLAQYVRADDYRGRRVRWSGWVRPSEVAGPGAGLWMAVHGPRGTTAFDDMDGTRAIVGTTDWAWVSVVLDVSDDAIGLAFGAILAGPGDLVADDFGLEVVGTDVPTTNQLTTPRPEADSATTAAFYANAPAVPANLGFEGYPEPAQATIAWVTETAVPLSTVRAGTERTDLMPLRDMVGTARVAALGEGTHGTKEFFQMKHRVFEFLVGEMGFTHFAIEASWQEANEMNAYVVTGVGDPERLLSGLHFWTWRTQEVLDLVHWMREWNLTAPADRQVQFLGFDMQYPGAAMDTVSSYIQRVDRASTPFVDQRYECLRPYRDIRGQFSESWSSYANLPAGTRNGCRAGLQEVFDLIDSRREEFQAASSPAVYANALHSARVVQQWEDMVAGYGSIAGGRARDRYMAENVRWLLQQGGGDTRMMLWAHNGHVSRVPGAMGWHLDSALGADYVTLGFLFGRGWFNAVEMRGGTFTGVGVKPFYAVLAPNSSLEAVFLATQQARLLLDARRIPEGGPAAAPLRGPIPMRAIGCCYDAANEAAYFSAQVLPGNFDLLIYLRYTLASTLLPFVPSPTTDSPSPWPLPGPTRPRSVP